MTNQNEHLYLNICYNYFRHSFEYDVDKYKWCDPIPYNYCGPYFQTSDRYKLKIWLDLNGLKLHKRIILPHLHSKTYSLIKK